MSISREKLVATFAQYLGGDALEADVATIAQGLQMELPSWFADISASIETTSSSGSPRHKLWAACFVDGESYALVGGNGRLEVFNFTTGESWALPSTECTASSDVTVATLLVQNGHADVCVGDSKGNVECFLLDLATNDGFELIATTVVPGPVLSLRSAPWTSALSCFLCWVTTNSSVYLCGASDNAKLRVCLSFSLPSGRCKTVLRTELVDSTLGQQALFAACMASPDNHIVVVTIDAIAASILAQRVLLSNEATMQLKATLALDSSLSSTSSVFFGNRSAMPIFATLLPNSVVGLHPRAYDWSDVEKYFGSPPSLSVMVVQDSAILHLLTLDTPYTQIMTALSQVDVLHSAQYTTATLSLRTVLSRMTFPPGQVDPPTVSQTVLHETKDVTPLWRACVDYYFQLPWRNQPIQMLARQLGDHSLSARDQVLATKIILLEAMLAVGWCTRVQKSLATPLTTSGGTGDENEEGIQRLFDWVVSPTQTLSTPSLLEDCKTALTGTLLFRVLPFLLTPSGQSPALPSLVVSHALDEAFGLWKAVAWLTQALLDRKLVALCGSNTISGWDEQAMATILPDTLLSHSTIEVFTVHEKTRVLGVTLRLVETMLKMCPVGLQAFLPVGRGASFASVSLLRERHAQLDAEASRVSRTGARLPDCLQSSSLFRSLVSHLPPGLQSLVDLASMESQGPAQALREVLLLPYYAMEVFWREVLDNRLYVDMSLEQVRRQSAQAVHTSRMVVLYLLMDNFDALGEQVEAFYEEFAQALQCTQAEVVCAAAFQALDRGQAGVVQRLLHDDVFPFLDRLSWPATQKMALRMLSLGQQEEAHGLMMQLAAREDVFLRTKEGVVAYLATLSVQDWEMKWQRGRMLADELPSEEEGLEARSIMTSFLCDWAVQHQLLPDLLQQDLHPVEFDVVLAFLTDRAIVDTERLVAPSDAVDTLVAWLLTHHRYEEARDVHSTHCQALQECRLALTEEAQRSIQDRLVLLTMHDRLPTLPSVDYQLLRQLKE